MIPWQFWIRYVFEYANAKNDFRLFRVWLKLTYEIPAKSERDYRVAGLPTEENKSFWMAEDRFNALFYRAANVFLTFACSLVVAQFFLVQFDVQLWIYLLVQIVHLVYTNFYIWMFIHLIYTGNVFFLGVVKFFAKKFSHISKRVRRLAMRTKKVDNRKLARLICE